MHHHHHYHHHACKHFKILKNFITKTFAYFEWTYTFHFFILLTLALKERKASITLQHYLRAEIFRAFIYQRIDSHYDKRVLAVLVKYCFLLCVCKVNCAFIQQCNNVCNATGTNTQR